MNELPESDQQVVHANIAGLKTLLDDVNIEDRGCTEKVYKGLCSGHAARIARQTSKG